MNQIEMISPGRTSTAAAYCRGVAPLNHSPASFDHDEHGLTRSQAGQPALGCYASIHVHGGHGQRVSCVQVTRGRSVDAFLPGETDRRLGSNLDGGLFPRERCSNSLADQFLVAERQCQRVAQRHQCHVKRLRCYVPTGSKRAFQSAGNFFQKGSSENDR